MKTKQFILPSRPKLQYIEKREDLRKFAIVPFRACKDERLSRADLITLIMLAGYSSPNGYGFVALSTMAKLRGIKPQSVSRSIKRLEAKGYVQTVRKGYTNLRGALRRILFDSELTEVEQVSISNTNQVEVYDMEKHIQKRSKSSKQVKADDSSMSFDEAILVVQHSLKSDADILKLERLVSQGITKAELIAAFEGGSL